MFTPIVSFRREVSLACWVSCFCFLVVIPLHLQAQDAFVNFESKQTSPIRLSRDGSKLFAVNTPDNRLSVFDITTSSRPILIAEIPVGLDPVSVNPRTDNEIWVVNEVSDSVSIVSLSQRQVVETLAVKDEPADVVFAQDRAFVTAARQNEIRVFDVATRTQINSIPLAGENPRALAVNAAGTRVYAAFALSGNRTTLVPPNLAPAQPAPPSATIGPCSRPKQARPTSIWLLRENSMVTGAGFSTGQHQMITASTGRLPRP